jgi:hypothetical protein
MSPPSGAGPAWRAPLVILLAWLFLFWLGYPLAFVDDMYFVGAPINWLHGGGFYNPWCPAMLQMDSVHEFFVYMPFHGYVVAGWMKIFGISRVSLVVFQWLMAVLATFGLWIAARRFSNGLLLPLGLVACVAIFLGASGLRPEALGLAMLAWSWVLLETRSSAAFFFCGLLAAGTVFTSPNIGAIAPVVIIWALILAWRGDRSQAARCIFSLFVGGLISLVLFLWTIQFQLGHFLEVFAAVRKVSILNQNPTLFQALAAHPIAWRDAFRDIMQLYVPCALLLALVIAMLMRRDLFAARPSRAGTALVIAGAGFLAIPELSSAQGKFPLAFYAMVAGLVLCLNVAPLLLRRLAIGLWSLVFLIFLFGFGHQTLQLLCRPALPATQAESLREAIAKIGPAPLYADEYAEAALFDYNLPANTLDYHFSLPDRFTTFDPANFPPGSYLVISKETLLRAKAYDRYHLGPPPTLIPLVGRFFTVKPANPYDIVIVPGGPQN